MSTPLLRVEGLEVGYGRVQVLFGVDLEVAEGEVLAVLGANAAGKSTLLRAVTGLTPPWRGRVLLDGEDVTGSPPGAMARRGVVQMPGGRGIFPDLSVGDNLRMATWLERRSEARVAESMGRAVELFPVLGQRLSDRAGLLSGGQQQMLSLALAFMGRPRLLLVDELSLGLAPALVDQLLGVVARLRDEGVTIVLVEQSPDRALGVADRALFLEKGEVRYDGPAAVLAQRDDLLRPVFLSAASPSPNGSGAAAGATVGGAPILSASGVSKHFGGVTALAGVDLAVAPGEIVGLLGPNGAGKTTLLDVLSGFVVPDSGSVAFWGQDVTGLPPEARAHRGLGRSFQDALLFPGLTTSENLALSCERWVTSREPLAAGLRLPASLASEAMVSERVERLLGLLGLAWLRDKFPDQLSTGARRLVEFGSLLAQEPDVLLLDEPSAGIARAEAAALAPLLRRIRDASGAAMVIVEHDMALLRASCDRLVAMDEGRVVAEGRPAEVLAAL